jgi:hypothetical protein
MKVYLLECTYPCYEHVIGVYANRVEAERTANGDEYFQVTEWEVEE